MRYRMILFDFFNTLVVSDSSRLPTLVVEGREVVSTAALLQRRLAERHPDCEVMAVHRALRSASEKARRKRGPELREPPALERFRDVAAELGLDPLDERTPRELLACHMEAVTHTFRFPPEHQAFLARLRKKYRLGIFSNFDHAPSLHGILERNGIESWFDPVVISETIGFRKPGAAAFREALALAGETRECILFVGDSLEDDVRGAVEAGLDVAWVNSNGEGNCSGHQPTYVLNGLLELEPLLEKVSSRDV